MRKKCSIIILLLTLSLNSIVPVVNAAQENVIEDENIINENIVDDSTSKSDEPKEDIITSNNEEEKLENEDVKTNTEEQKIDTINSKVNLNGIVNKKGLKGTYIIESAIDTNKCLDVYGAYTDNGTNVQLFREDKGDNKKFELIPTEDDDYIIKAVHSGKVLDVYEARDINGTNVTQYMQKSTDNENQRWILQDAGNGTYNIISKCNGKYLDVHGAYIASGTNIEVYQGNGGNNQKFILKDAYIKPEKTIDDGIYEIQSVIGRNMCFDISGATNNDGANLQIYQRNGNKNQKFKITKNTEDDYYTIKALHSQKVLDVYGAYKTKGTNVTQYHETNADNQQWIIKKDKDGVNYNIISKCNELYLDIYGANGNKTSNVEVYEGHGGDNQKFTLKPVEEKDIDNPILPEREYKIFSISDEDKVLEVKDGTAKDGTKIQLAKAVNKKEQVFSLKYNDDGTYVIKPTFSGRTLDIEGKGVKDGTKVQEYRDVGGENQRWKIKDAGDGSYTIEATYVDNFCMSVNGNDIVMKKNNGSDKQKFKIVPYERTENPLVYDGTYKITTAISSNMALDVIDGSKEAKKGVQIWNNFHVLNQKFILKHLGNNVYTIEVAHSDMALELATDGSNVVRQNTKRDVPEQKWKLEDAGNGYYYILSEYDNALCLNVYGAYTENGTKVQAYRKNGNDNEKWKFQEMYFGIDVSEHNKELDFNALAQSKQMEFIIDRVGWYSSSKKKFNLDKQFTRNYDLAKKKEMPIGAYLYSYAQNDNDAREEANALVSALGGRNFELPIFLDIEDPDYQANLSKQQRTNICLIFGEILKNAGYKVGIYTFKNWALGAIDMEQIPSDYSIWIAAWGANNGTVPKDIYKYAGEHDIWQYSSTGWVEGVSGNVDVNVAYKKLW